MTEADMIELATAGSIEDYHTVLARLYSEGKISLEDVVGTLIEEHITLCGTGEPPNIVGSLRAIGATEGAERCGEVE